MAFSKAELCSTVEAKLRFLAILPNILKRVVKGSEVVAVVFMWLLLASVFMMAVGRSFFSVGLAWLDDLARYLQIWVVYTAAISITMKGEHITMDAWYIRMSSSWQLWVRRATGMICLVFCAATGYWALCQAIEVARLGEASATGVFPAIIGYASLPFGFGLMICASLHYLLYGVR